MVKWWQTGLILILTFVLAVSVRNDFLFFLFGFEIMVVVAAVVFVRVQAEHVSMKVGIERQAVSVGETFRVKACFANDSVLPVSRVRARLAVRVFPEKDELLLTGSIMLASGDKGDICFEMDGSHVQSIDIRADKLVIEDYLGIARRRIEVDSGDAYTMYILPKPERDGFAVPESDVLLSDGDGDEVKHGGMDVDVSEIRQYMNGDPVKLVHWKLSARLDDLMVRSLSDPAGQYDWIFLNLDERRGVSDEAGSPSSSGKKDMTGNVRRTPGKWDRFVKTVSDVSLSLLDSGRQHMVCWVNAAMNKAEKVYVSDEESYQSMLMALLRTDTYSSREYTQLLEEIFSHESNETCIEIDLQGNTFRTGRP